MGACQGRFSHTVADQPLSRPAMTGWFGRMLPASLTSTLASFRTDRWQPIERPRVTAMVAFSWTTERVFRPNRERLYATRSRRAGARPHRPPRASRPSRRPARAIRRPGSVAPSPCARRAWPSCVRPGGVPVVGQFEPQARALKQGVAQACRTSVPWTGNGGPPSGWALQALGFR